MMWMRVLFSPPHNNRKQWQKASMHARYQDIASWYLQVPWSQCTVGPLTRDHHEERSTPLKRPLDNVKLNIDFYPWMETTNLERPHFWYKRHGLKRVVPLYMHNICHSGSSILTDEMRNIFDIIMIHFVTYCNRHHLYLEIGPGFPPAITLLYIDRPSLQVSVMCCWGGTSVGRCVVVSGDSMAERWS